MRLDDAQQKVYGLLMERRRTILIRVSEDEFSALTDAAKLVSLSLGSWMRAKMVEIARRLLRGER
jgi:hypothetical protein